MKRFSEDWFRDEAKKPKYISVQEKAKKQRENFLNKYGPDVLKKLNDSNLLNTMFQNEKGTDNMCSTLLNNETSMYVPVGMGSMHQFYLYYDEGRNLNKKRNPGVKGWTIGSPRNEKKVSEIEALTKGKEIRDNILSICNYLGNPNTNGREVDYNALGKMYRKVFNRSIKYLKYFAIVYPDVIPIFYVEKWRKTVLSIIEPDKTFVNNQFDNYQTITEYIKTLNIDPVVFGNILFDQEEFNGKEKDLQKEVEQIDSADMADSFVAEAKKDDTIFSYDDNGQFVGENTIIYGTPGCGKSYYLENEVLTGEDHPKVPSGAKRNVFRTTFYQDYTNTDFVGQILPKIEGERVTYDFVPGPFTLALECAVAHPDQKTALVIEELNRGNAPGIFGDLFQLLDRDENGVSRYPIVNVPIQNYLNRPLEKKKSEYHYGLGYIKIPANLYIYATMNTSDQNVFTLDTAFKRRWRFEKISNIFDNSKDKAIAGKPVPGFDGVTWRMFVETINKHIINHPMSLSSEDKQLGKYFVEESLLSDDNKLAFGYKVLEYLWNDVAKFNRKDWFVSEIKSLDMLLDNYKKGMAFFVPELDSKLPLSVNESDTNNQDDYQMSELE